MKNTMLGALLLMLLLSSCSKSNDKNCSAINIAAPAAEIAVLKKFIDSNHIDAIADPRGFYYKIHAAGSAKKPTICSPIIFSYTGKFLNNAEFDSGTNVSGFYLSNLILGWQEGIPLIGAGGSITLYIPPSLGYGPNDYQDIPGNSDLIFDITLNSF